MPGSTGCTKARAREVRSSRQRAGRTRDASSLMTGRQQGSALDLGGARTPCDTKLDSKGSKGSGQSTRALSTVAHSLIRGSEPHSDHSSEGCLYLRSEVPGRLLATCRRVPSTDSDALAADLGCELPLSRDFQELTDAGRNSWPIAQTKPTNSRAIAVVTSWLFFPRAVRRR
jgi:hypothetical protein